MNFCFSSRVGAFSILVAALMLAAGAVDGRERYGQWTVEARAEVAEEFMDRMEEEFQGRAARLKVETGAVVKVDLPFIASRTELAGRKAKDWKQFREGKMGENGTTRWIETALKELESVRGKLARGEKSANKSWLKKYKDHPPVKEVGEEAQAFLYEMQVQAHQLGVILDCSYSMAPYLEAIRAEIAARFPSANFAEVDSSYLKTPSKDWGLQGAWFYSPPLPHRNLFAPEAWLAEIPQNDLHYHVIQWERDTMAAMTAMVDAMEVDAIYWFCDLDDSIESQAVKMLDDILSRRKVRLYVHSMKSSPPAILNNLIKRSGGSFSKAAVKAAAAPVK